MTTPTPESRSPRPGARFQLAAGVPAILVGFACYFLTDLFDGGFLRGLFQGATIALMVIGAYLIGAGLWHARKGEQELDDGAQWLPSRDNAGGDSAGGRQ